MTAHLVRGDARMLPGFGESVAQQLHAALSLTVTPKGHHPDCAHRQWRGDWDNRSRHECDVEGCDRTGQPCTKRCAQVRAALALEVKG